MTTEQAVFSAIAKVARRSMEQIDADWVLSEDNGIDSLGFVEIAMSLETQLGIKLPDSEAAAARTAGELVDICRHHGGR